MDEMYKHEKKGAETGKGGPSEGEFEEAKNTLTSKQATKKL